MKTVRIGRLILLIVTLLSSGMISAQDRQAAGEGRNAPVPPAETQSPADTRSLLERTLELDIRTAGYYELIDWLTKLGLDTKGSREELQKRLYAHYSITPEAAGTAGGGQKGRTITIEAAENTEYFTLESTDERYIRLSGNVIMEVIDPENNSVHRIVAEEIIYNQTEDLFTARGNVAYTLKQSDREERFTGETISFRIDNWEGSFFEGITSRERTVDSKNMTFYFKGDSIVRSEEDVIVMTDGDITSCDEEDPHYRIHARKIWLLAPGEWGLSHAVLYVGRIPVLYFPFFFYPGDDVFFNPVFGYRDREGTYIQTTTYFIGERKRTDSSFSFLQLGEEEDSDTVKEREGLFLVRSKTKKPTDYTKNWYWKLMVDLYTRLGSFIGTEGKLSTPKILKKIDFDMGIGFSRNIYPGNTVPITYSPYYIDPVTGAASEHWNTSRFFGVTLPFRYGMSLSFDLGLSSFSLAGNFAMYSDPFYRVDFFNRSEDIDWGKLFNMEEQALPGTVPPSAVNSYNWNLSGGYRVDTKILSPWISRLDFTDFRMEMGWTAKQIPSIDLEPFERLEKYPDKYFYIPENITYPNLNISLSGTLFSTAPAARSSVRNPAGTPASEGGLKAPWESPDTGTKTDNTAGNLPVQGDNFRLPSLLPDEPERNTVVPVRFDLGYQLTNRFTHGSKTDSREWSTFDAVDYSLLYSSVETVNRLSVTGKLDLYRDLLSLTTSIQMRGNYRTHYNETDVFDAAFSEAKWMSLRNDDYTSSYFDATLNVSLQYAPLLFLPPLAASRVTYTFVAPLTSYVYDKRLDEEGNPVYRQDNFAWDKEKIQTHSVSFTLSADVFQNVQTLNVTSVLPPEDREFSGSLNLKLWILSAGVSSSVKEVEEDWIFRPIVFTTALNPFTGVSLSESFTYDPEEDYWTSIVSTLRLWTLSVIYTMQRQVPYRFDWTAYQWIEDGEKELIPSSIVVRHSYTYSGKPFWKNRIKQSLNFETNWSMNLVRYTDSPLSFKLDYSIDISNFTQLTLSSRSQNDAMYLYLPLTPERYRRNIFTDLMKSFNFFNIEDRYESSFKIKYVSVKLSHSLHDWDLTCEYIGRPERIVQPGGIIAYVWNTAFSIFLQWKPIPEIKNTIKSTREEPWTF